MRRLSLVALAAVALILPLSSPASAGDSCDCGPRLGGYFKRPFTDARAWRGLPTMYYRAYHRRPHYHLVYVDRHRRVHHHHHVADHHHGSSRSASPSGFAR
jgi:hypothetical protein